MRFIVCDRWGNPLGDLVNVTNAVRTRSVDGTDTLDLTMIDTVNKDERVVLRDTDGRWSEYVVQETDTSRDNGKPVTRASCSSSISVLSRCWIEDRSPSGGAGECLSIALEGTGWEPGTVQVGTITPSAPPAFYHCSVLDAVQSVAESYGLEIQTEVRPDPTGARIGRRIIHMFEQRGNHIPTKRFEYGKDLAGITRTVDPSDVVTRLYGWGKGVDTGDENVGGYGRKLDFSSVNGGLKYVEDTQATETWGIPGPGYTRLPSVGSVEFGDCEDPDELLRLTREKLQSMSKPVVSYEASVIALGEAGVDAEGVDVGDSIQIVDSTFEQTLRLDGRVLKIEDNLVDGESSTTITLGSIGSTWTQRLASQQQALDKLVSNSGAWDSAAAGTGTYIGDVIDRVNQVMNAKGGYIYMVPGEGIYVYDRPADENPSQAIQIGGGYFRVANGRKSNGEWDWKTLGSGAGIIADLIVAGVIRGGANEWNLDTGELSFENGVIRSVDGRSVWDLTNSTFKTSDMQADNISATGQITSTYNGTSAAIKGGTMTYTNNSGGRLDISATRLDTGSNSWCNLEGDGFDTMLFRNKRKSYDSDIYVIAGDFLDGSNLFLEYGQFASLEVDMQNQLIISDGGVQHDSTSYYTAEVRDEGDHMILDMGQGTNAPSRIWLGISNSYDPCLKINRESVQLSCNELNRIDLAASYAALVHGNYHVMVDANGVSQTTRSAAATGIQSTLMEQRLMQLADDGVDLSDPSGYSVQPAAIDEIRIGQVHDILRKLVDGDTDGARSLLDQIEAEQHIWTQSEIDAFDAAAKTDHPTGKAEADRIAHGKARGRESTTI